MQCIRPIMANFDRDSTIEKKIITFKRENAIDGLCGFTLPCRKCLPCRLNQAREKAIRCYHESKMHENNIFLTLTYDEQHLKSPKLQYEDFQLFMKRLRRTQPQKIPLMVTGEYGEHKKRPHFHALLFNYRPDDQEYKYTTDRGDTCYKSNALETLWSKGQIEYGDVTIDSANYVARYAAKKLVHGPDENHDFHPVHKTSSRYGIGRSWIEKYFEHPLKNGFVVLPNGQKSKVPRYYLDWARKHQYPLWEYYVTQVQPKIQKLAEEQSASEIEEFLNNPSPWKLKRSNVKEIILQSKFKQLQEKLKL